MKNKLNVLKYFILVIISALTLSGCSLMDFLFPNQEVATYGFSGYVFADDKALEGATVSCGLSETVTDERGYYSFAGLSKVVQVEVSKDGFYFDKSLVYVNSDRNDVNFEGNKYFNISGVVKNGNSVIDGAEVSVISKAGTHTTKTESTGNFYLSDLAGVAMVSASFEDIEFFTVEATKEDSYITINSTIDIVGKINCDDVATASDFTLKVDNKEVANAILGTGRELIFNLRNVVPNSVITLESETYYIDNNYLKVVGEKEVDFNCEKYYSVNIETVSGITKLNGANITMNGEPITRSQLNSEIILNDLYGENIFGATLNGYIFEDVTSNAQNTNIFLVGKFNLLVNILTDDNIYDEIKVFVNDIGIDVLNDSLRFEGVELNSIITVLTDNYYVQNSIQEISAPEVITLNLYRFYNLKLKASFEGSALPQTKVTLNGSEYKLNTNGELIVENLYGENTLEFSLDGYKFDSYILDLNNNDINAVAKKLFNLSGRVLSGNLIIENAIVTINEKNVVTDANGEFIFEDLFDSGKIIVTKQGFNKKEVNFETNESDIIINLTYNITGKVLCGTIGIGGVTVSSDNNSVTTNIDGTFTLQNLQGESEITFEKDYYNIESETVTHEENLTISSTYYITGTVTDSAGESIDNLLIILNDVLKDSNGVNRTQTVYTTNGTFKFDNLTSEYLLTYGEVDFTLKPNYHSVISGGNYDFSNNGYGFSGRVMCGNNAVGGVSITAGDKTVVTDAQGYYTFALLTKPTILTLYKEGYTFNNNNLAVDGETFDERTDINFNCSYKVIGTVLSGITPIVNAVVNVNGKEVLTNKNGYYEVDNLEGSGTIRITKKGYTFIGENFVNEFTTINYKGYYTAKYKVVTGNIAVENVEFIINNKIYLTDELGLVEIQNAEIGTGFTLNKQGYNFSTYSFMGFNEEVEEINCSYNITGVIFSGTNVVGNCLVIVSGGTSVLTNSNGEFSFNNLIGEKTISFTLENFQFEDIDVSGPTNIEVYAKYTVTGVVKVGSNALSNVIVRAGNFTATTNGAGRFEITGLTTRVVLILEKDGYEFEGTFEVNSPCELEFSATYSVCGFVTSGENNGVEGVLVTSSLGGKGILTDINGYYEVKGQIGIITLTFEKDGYKTEVSQEINSYVSNLNINLSYSVIINFSGVEDFSGIYIAVNGVRKEYSTSEVILEGLTGINNLKFTKTGYSLTPNEYGVEGYTVISVTIIRYYEAYFTVKTDNGIIVDDAIVQVGTKQVLSQGNGLYIANELSNKVNTFVVLNVKDESGNDLYSKRIAGPTIDSEGSYSIIINNSDYAYFMFVRAYERLRESYSYVVNVSGVVDPQTSLAGSQKVGMTYKKVGDERLYENLNYGKGALDVEPRVSLLTYTNLKTKEVKYEMVKGDNVKDNLTANYTCNFTTTDYKGYQSKFGISPEGFFPYNITNSTITLGTFSNLSYNNNQYQFTISFGTGDGSPANDLIVANYRTLMNEMVKGQTTKNYNYIRLTFTFDEYGNIKTLNSDEQYVVEAPVIGDIKTNGNITYTYSSSNDTTINKIDISSNDAIRRTISETLPENTINAINNINTYILTKRRELV